MMKTFWYIGAVLSCAVRRAYHSIGLCTPCAHECSFPLHGAAVELRIHYSIARGCARACISFHGMDDTKRSVWRRAVTAASVSLLVAIPVFAAAAPRNLNHGESLGTAIFNSVIQRLCEAQQRLGNRVTLVDPSRCAVTPPPPPPAPMLTVTKVVVNDNGGTATTTDFAVFIDGATTTSGVSVVVSEGVHTVTENPSANYFATFG